MKYATDRPFADPEKAARKIVEIANATEAVQDAAFTSRRSTARSCSLKAAAQRNTAPGLSLRSRRAGCGGMNPEPMSNSRRQARNCSLEDKRPRARKQDSLGPPTLWEVFFRPGWRGLSRKPYVDVQPDFRFQSLKKKRPSRREDAWAF
jgi:hypothetical protein